MQTFSNDHPAIQKLSRAQGCVTQRSGTEAPGAGPYLGNELGIDVVLVQTLFASSEKCESGTGWPSFTRSIESANLNELRHTAHGTTCTEARSTHAEGHLVQVFPDGRKERGGSRYCIDSASRRLVQRDDVEAEGFGAYVNQVEDSK